jgi:type I restriction enzyme M protein
MNLYLHGITPDRSPIVHRDALMQKDARSYDYVLTNPPFGRKQSYRTVGEDGEIEVEREDYERDDFIVTTGNKQLNFLQHIMSILAATGQAAVVLPDNVLFETGGGERIRRKLLDQFDFHTLLRLPTGIFYKPGVIANVLFFDAKPASDKPWTKDLWVYDFRTNHHFTLKERPLTRAHLDDFVAAYRADDRRAREPSERFRCFSYEELMARERLNLDIFWLKNDSLTDPDHLPSPATIAGEIVENLEAALEQFRAVAAELNPAIESPE